MTHLNSFSAFSSFQSAYRKFHSVETALLKVHNDLICAIDNKRLSALILLDLSAAFDTVDHNILLSRLSLNFGFCGSALSLLKSYLFDRTQSVTIDSFVSEPSLLTSGVPQGSVLGPLLFSLYTICHLLLAYFPLRSHFISTLMTPNFTYPFQLVNQIQLWKKFRIL